MLVSFTKNKKELITLRYDLAEYRFEKDTAVINHTHNSHKEPNPAAAVKRHETNERKVMVCMMKRSM